MQLSEASLLSQLKALEVELHQPVVRRDAGRLDALLHDDFQEFGRSGTAYTKADIVASLLAATQHALVVADNFFVRRLAAGVALLTYRSAHAQPDGSAADFFEALCRIRLQLEKEGLRLFCYGASLNVYPSPMARDMGAGLKAYKMSHGRHASRADLVDIFSDGPDVIPANVSQQQEFFEHWVASDRR